MSRVTEYLKWTRVQAKIASYTEARVLVRSPTYDQLSLTQWVQGFAKKHY